jgi:hypothetical protein
MALSTQNFDNAITFVPEELFEYVPKDLMLSAMKEAYADSNLNITQKDIKILKIKKTIEVKNILYARFEYEATLAIQFYSPSQSENENEKRINDQIFMMKQRFGKDFKSYDMKTDIFNVYEKKEVFASNKMDSSKWKFLVSDKDNQELLEMIMPNEITAD